MKIVMFSDVFLPKIDGIVSAILNISEGMANKGHKVYIVAPRIKRMKKEYKHKNIKVIRVGSVPAFFYEDLRFTNFFSYSLFRYFKKEKIDIVHFHTPMNTGIFAISSAKFLNVPLVGTFHINIAHPDCLKHARLNYPIVQGLAWSYLRAFYNRCDLVSVPSESTKKDLLTHGCKREIKVISNGIDSSVFDNSKWEEVKNKFNKKGPIVLYVGRISHEKNVSFLIESFSLALKKIPSAKLLIVGGGPQMQDAQQLCDKLGIKDNIVFTGPIPHSKLIRSGIFRASELFAIASTTETQGIATLEAQVNGLVCVGLNVGGTKDLIKNNYNGFLVSKGRKRDFANAIVKGLTDKTVYSRLRKNTLKEVKKHELSHVINIWEKTYSSLLKNEKDK